MTTNNDVQAVPPEITEAMLEAGEKEVQYFLLNEGLVSEREAAQRIFLAMSAASNRGINEMASLQTDIYDNGGTEEKLDDEDRSPRTYQGGLRTPRELKGRGIDD